VTGVALTGVLEALKAASLRAGGGRLGRGCRTCTYRRKGEAMVVTKIKSWLAVVLAIAALAGAGEFIYQTQAAEQATDYIAGTRFEARMESGDLCVLTWPGKE
jgi:hypothetical protein